MGVVVCGAECAGVEAVLKCGRAAVLLLRWRVLHDRGQPIVR